MDLPDGVEITGPLHDRFEEILTPTALELVAVLQRELGGRRTELLAVRQTRVENLAAGGTLGFLDETRSVREDESWRVADPAPGLVDRRVEITGPTDRKMTINALNSGAQGVARRPRGRQHPAVGERRRRTAETSRRGQPADRLHQHRRQELHAEGR